MNNKATDSAAATGNADKSSRLGTVVVIGYGSQGKAHANNLKDSGTRVVIGARENGTSWQAATRDGFEVMTPELACDQADLVALLTPDLAQPQVYGQIEAHLKPGTTLLFAHGFNIHYGCITPRNDIDVVLVAPKGPGDLVRREYQSGHGVPCLSAVHQDASGLASARVQAYAAGIGGSRAGTLGTSFAEETETDLFGEQAVLCGGVSELVISGFETLVDAGYQPEVAYFECMHELKLIVDLLHEGGFEKMYEFISETATYGDLVSGPRVIDGRVRENMKQVLEDIRNGNFARRWIDESKQGMTEYSALMNQRTALPIEKTGQQLRARMPWLKPAAASEKSADDGKDRAA